MITPKEALDQDFAGWTKAYIKDLAAKMANKAFEYVKRTADMITHKTGWAHKIVWSVDNTIEELRARLVARGYSQVEGRDFKSAYASTPPVRAVRMFLMCIAYHDIEDEHCDVISHSITRSSGARGNLSGSKIRTGTCSATRFLPKVCVRRCGGARAAMSRRALGRLLLACAHAAP